LMADAETAYCENGLTPTHNPVFMALPRSAELKWNLDRFLPEGNHVRS
jgi:hypothetical protein